MKYMLIVKCGVTNINFSCPPWIYITNRIYITNSCIVSGLMKFSFITENRSIPLYKLSDKMEVNTQNIQQLALYLQKTLSPQNEVRKPAEEFLQSVEVNQNYPVLLLHLLQSEGIEPNIKVWSHHFLQCLTDNLCFLSLDSGLHHLQELHQEELGGARGWCRQDPFK